MSKKKILFIHPDLKGGGAERVLVNLINKLPKSEYEVSLFTIFEEGVNKKFLSKEIKHIFWFKNVFRGYSVIQKIFSPKFLAKNVKISNANIVVAYLEHVPTRIGFGFKNVKKVAWIHSNLNLKDLSKAFRSKKEMIQAYNSFDKIVCVSEESKKSFLKATNINQNKVLVLKNIIDFESIENLSNIKEVELKKSFSIVTIGRLIEVKGYDRLLTSINEIKKINLEIDFHLYILGDGHLKSNFSQFIKENNLEDYVTLLGFQENPYQFLKQADLYVCSSYNEGYNTAITEALYLKIPVVTTNCSGMNEILNNGEYGIITENDTESLKTNILRILTDKELYNQLKAKAEIKSELLKKQNSTTEVEQLFDSL